MTAATPTRFIPFPANSIPAGYLAWEAMPSPTLLIYHPDDRFWEVHYPAWGIRISCYPLATEDANSWKLEASTQEVGFAPPIPLLTCVYRPGQGLIETYRYAYPANYLHPQELAFFKQEISNILVCFQGIADHLLSAHTIPLAPPIEAGRVNLVKGGEAPEEASYQLITHSEDLYYTLSSSWDDEKSIYTSPVFKNESKVPLAFLSIDPAKKSYRLEDYVDYQAQFDAAPCAQLAAAVLEELTSTTVE